MTKPFCRSIFEASLCAALILVGSKALAGACCGGGFAAPSVIVGDDAGSMTASYGMTEIDSDVGDDGLWRKRDARETSETYRIDAAHIALDRFQGGVTIPVVTRSRAGEQSSGFGDIGLTGGYEYLPDWDYNPWRPRGLGFLQLILPTGRSVSEADSDFQLDARGRGFWAVGAGTILTKIISRYDVYLSLDAHRAFDRTFDTTTFHGTLKPGYGGNLGLGAGYNLAIWRFGGGITWTYEDAIGVAGSDAQLPDSSGSLQRFATAALSVSLMLPEKWTASAQYLDQTLFGSPLNASLGRGVMLALQKHWER